MEKEKRYCVNCNKLLEDRLFYCKPCFDKKHEEIRKLYL